METKDLALKRAWYRSKNRGCKETDILLGRFADSHIEALSEEDLAGYERFLEESDSDIYAWITGKVEFPPEYAGLAGKLKESNGI